MRQLKFQGRIVPMAVVLMMAMALTALVSCEKDAITDTRPTVTSGFDMERAVVDLIYGHIPGQREEDIQSQYQSLVSGLSTDQLNRLHQAAEENYMNNAAPGAAGVQQRSPGATLSPGDMTAAFGVDVARSGNSVIVGAGTAGENDKIYFFEQGDLVAEFTSDNPYSFGFGFEVGISGNRAVAIGLLVDVNSEDFYLGGEIRTYQKQGGSWQLDEVIVLDEPLLGNIAMSGNRFVVTGRPIENLANTIIQVFKTQGNNGWQHEQSFEYPMMHVWDADIKANTIAVNGVTNGNIFAPTVHIFEYAGGSWTPTSQVPLISGFTFLHRNVAIGNDAYIVANVASPQVVFEITSSGGSWAVSGQLTAPGTSLDRAIAAQGEKVAVTGGGFGAPVVYTFDAGVEDETYGPGSGSYGSSLYVYGNETGVGAPGAPEGVVYLEH